MTRRQAPLEFSSLGFFGDFQSSDGRSWRGPCPQCGGHRRFLVFTDREYPYWNYLCSCCNNRGMVNQLLGDQAKLPTEEDRQRWKEQREARDREEAENAAKAVERFVRERIWEVAHAQIEESDLAWWKGRGIEKDWVDYWLLGAVDRIFYQDEQPVKVPTYTIPKFQIGELAVPKNCDFRLLRELPNLGKYMGIKNLPPAVFVARPDLQQAGTGEVFVVEGSIKAMVLYTRLAQANESTTRQVIGVPAARSWVNVIDLLQGRSDRVYVMLDPDAAEAGKELAKEIGRAARVLTLPVKIDDAFTHYGLDVPTFETYLRQARTT
jgi:5S rRNA maturation endonuclease (ribonuclease M5)